MTKYILHGGFTRIDNDLNRGFWAEVARDVPEDGTVLLVFFAAKEEDIPEKASSTIESIKTQANGKTLNFVVATEKGFLNQLTQADAVYIHGGRTPKLLKVLKKYPDLKKYLDGKTVAGSSAGAYAIGRYSPFHDDESGGEVREGLGLLPLRVVCHYESPDLPPNPRAFSSLGAMALDLELVLLKDFEWRVFTVYISFRRDSLFETG